MFSVLHTIWDVKEFSVCFFETTTQSMKYWYWRKSCFWAIKLCVRSILKSHLWFQAKFLLPTLHSAQLALFITLACADYKCYVFCYFKGVSSLSKCSTLMSSLLATVMANWEVHRDVSVDQSSLHFKVTCFITDLMTKVCRFCWSLSALPLEMRNEKEKRPDVLTLYQTFVLILYLMRLYMS